MIEFLSKNWIGSLIGLIGIIISVAVSYYFYKKSEQKALPTYTSTTTQIMDIENAIIIDNIEIKYKGKKINRLIRSYIAFWNDGNKTIDGKDIVEKDKLRVDFGDNEGEILSINIAKCTRDINGFDVKVNPENEREILFSFNFLDTKDGALIEVLHTFNGIPRVKGTIKGIPQGIKDSGVDITLVNSRKRKVSKILYSAYLWFSSGLFFIIGLYVLYVAIYSIEVSSKPVMIRIVVIFINIICMFFLPTMAVLQSRKRIPKNLMLEVD